MKKGGHRGHSDEADAGQLALIAATLVAVLAWGCSSDASVADGVHEPTTGSGVAHADEGDADLHGGSGAVGSEYGAVIEADSPASEISIPGRDSVPVLPRAVISQENTQTILFLPHGEGELRLDRECVVVVYLVPGERSIRPFTLVTANATGSPAAGEHRAYVEIRGGKLVLVADRYRRGTLSRSTTHRHGDGFGAHLPVPVIEWVTPIPDDCPSDWLWIEG